MINEPKSHREAESVYYNMILCDSNMDILYSILHNVRQYDKIEIGIITVFDSFFALRVSFTSGLYRIVLHF